MAGRFLLFKLIFLVLATGINSKIDERNGQFQNDGWDQENSISEVTALFDHEKGIILYKDPEIPACFLEESSSRDNTDDTELQEASRMLQISRGMIRNNHNVSTFQLEFCGQLPIFKIEGSTSDFVKSPGRVHGRKLKRVHRARRKRSENRHSFNTDFDSNGWPIPATQAQVQGAVSGHGFFSGQAQSIANSMSQSQLQMGGVGITGSLSSSAGGSQAQLSLGSNTGSGQASNSGLGPSTSQVQVQLGEQQSGSNALANVIQHHGTGSGSSTNQQQQNGGFGRTNFPSQQRPNNGLDYQQPQGHQYGGQFSQSGNGASQPQQQYFGQRGSPQFQSDGQSPQAHFQQRTGSQGYSNGHPVQVPQQQFPQNTGSQGGSYGSPVSQRHFQQSTGSQPQEYSNGRPVQVPQRHFQQSTGSQSQGHSNGHPVQVSQTGSQGISNGHVVQAPQLPIQRSTSSQGISNGHPVQVHQQPVLQTTGSNGAANGFPVQTPQQHTQRNTGSRGSHQFPVSGHPAQQTQRPVQQNVDSRGSHQFQPQVNGYPAEIPQYYAQPVGSRTGSGPQGTQQGGPAGIPSGYTHQGNGKFTQSQQIYINGYSQNGQRRQTGSRYSNGQVGLNPAQYPGTYVSAPGGQAQSQSVVLQTPGRASEGQSYYSDTIDTNVQGAQQDDGSYVLHYPTATTMLQTDTSNIQGPTQRDNGHNFQSTQGGISHRPTQDHTYGTVSHGRGQSHAGSRGLTEQGHPARRTSHVLPQTQQNGFGVPVPAQTQNENYGPQGVYLRRAPQPQENVPQNRVQSLHPTSQAPNIQEQNYDHRSQAHDTRTNQYYPPRQLNNGYYGQNNNFNGRDDYTPAQARPNLPLPSQSQGQPAQQTPLEQTGGQGQGSTTGNGGQGRCHVVTFTCTIMFESANGQRKLCRPKMQQNGNGQQTPVSSSSGICCC